jgi:hypothetical protein
MVYPPTPPAAESTEGIVTRLAGRIKGATGWMKFLGAFYVIGGALGALAVILLLLAGAVLDQFQDQLGEDLPGELTGFLVGYLVLSVLFVGLYIWMGVVLWQAADGIRDAHRYGAVAELETGLSKVRVFFVVVGAVTLCALVLGLIFLLLSVTVAADLTPSF